MISNQSSLGSDVDVRLRPRAWIDVERSGGNDDEAAFARNARRGPAATFAEGDGDVLRLGWAVDFHARCAAREPEIVDAVEDVGGVRRAASASAARAMTVPHAQSRTRDLVGDVAAEAAAFDDSCARRDGAPFHAPVRRTRADTLRAAAVNLRSCTRAPSTRRTCDIGDGCRGRLRDCRRGESPGPSPPPAWGRSSRRADKTSAGLFPTRGTRQRCPRRRSIEIPSAAPRRTSRKQNRDACGTSSSDNESSRCRGRPLDTGRRRTDNCLRWSSRDSMTWKRPAPAFPD